VARDLKQSHLLPLTWTLPGVLIALHLLRPT